MDHIDSILTWNIAGGNGLLGLKADDPDFVNIIKNHSIICLQETGCDFNIPRYVSHKDLRSNSRKGGVTTLVKSSIAKFCHREDPDILNQHDYGVRSINVGVIRISMHSNTCKDSYLINAYIPPANSKRLGNTTDSAINFEILQTLINTYSPKGNVILCGDLNTRLGLTQDIALSDNIDDYLDLPVDLRNNVDIPLNCPVSLHRNCQDNGTNSHKSLLLDIINTNNLIVLNGRTIGDSSGRFTCFKWNGNSVVDLFVCSTNLLSEIKSLSVKPHTLFSDHNPVVLSLWNNVTFNNEIVDNLIKFDSAPARYKTTPDSLSSFSDAQLNPTFTRELNNLLNEADSCTTKEQLTCLNNNFMNLINDTAGQNFTKTKPPSSEQIKPKHNAWFDKDCRSAKRDLNKSSRILNKHPENSSIKLRHRRNVKSYRKLIKSKKDRFFNTLNRKIKSGKTISWRDFNKLKKFTKSETKVDDESLNSFHNFFQNLYSDEHPTIDSQTKSALLDDALDIVFNSPDDPNDILNAPFSMEDLNVAINSLQSGKASSFDMMSNEIIKSFNIDTKTLLLKIFNLCLTSGHYLWGSSVITPIHKKGSINNPDNYRAIAVCSCIGKLLSSMLLDRLIIHRSINSPDPANQCGFTKGSQCNNHILSLYTIIEKYKLKKQKIFTIFIDLRKAFDLVCRQALLYKLACYGVTGGFFHLLKDMYTNSSSGHIKLNGKISNKFSIHKGTEQGHPLSPELFKVYFKDLSDLLNAASTNSPTLSGVPVSHLAWADDLVLLALDRGSLDRLIIIIEDYCNKWGLEINVNKTKFMILNYRCSNRGNHESPPCINGVVLEQVFSYCYLGIIIKSNGNFSEAISSLSQRSVKAQCSVYGVQSIDVSSIPIVICNSLLRL